jgi:glycosyltransferase involved in cell wall biosynthesis
MRVLAVTNLWPQDGGFRGVFVREQVAAVRRLGVEVDVEVVAQSRGKADYLLAAPRVRKRVRSGGHDLVHVHYGLTALAARFVGAVPRVLSLYGSDVNVGWQRLAASLGASGVAARVYPSRRLAEAAGDPTGYVVPNGVDCGLFRQPADRSAVRASLGLAPSELVVLFGALPANAVKGYDVFTDVLAALRSRGLPVRELVLAEPDQPRTRVVDKFAAADVLLVTSRKGTESGPLVVKEAAAMGLPVVSVDVGDVAEVLAGVTPSTVVSFPEPWGTPVTRAVLVGRLADAVAAVLATGLRSDGRERTTRYDEREVARQLVAVYREVLAR